MSEKQPIKYQYNKSGDSVPLRDLKEGDFFIYASDRDLGYPQIYQIFRVYDGDEAPSALFFVSELGSGKLEPLGGVCLVIKLQVSKIELIQ